MAPGVTNNYIGQKTEIDGKKVTVVSQSAAFITVVDDNGNKITRRKDAPIFEHLIEQNNKLITQIEDRIEDYQIAETKAKEEKKGFLAQIRAYCSEWGILDAIKSSEYQGLKDQYYSASLDATAAGNRIYSSYASIRDLKHDNAMYG